MLSKIKGRLTYANVLSTIAVFGVIAGGTAVAAGTSGAGHPGAAASGGVDKKVKKLKKRVSALEAAVAGLPPTGTVSYFNAGACPAGWSELSTAQGRYIVGLNPGGSLAATQGTALGNLENRAVGRHTHGVTDPGHSHTVALSEGDNATSPVTTHLRPTSDSGGTYSPSTSTDTTGITINPAGSVPGTNAPYIQLLVCQKG